MWDEYSALEAEHQANWKCDEKKVQRKQESNEAEREKWSFLRVFLYHSSKHSSEVQIISTDDSITVTHLKSLLHIKYFS